MSPRRRSALADWEPWYALTMVALLGWILARQSRFWLMARLQLLPWSLHGVVPFVPQASLDQVRPVVDAVVAMWLPVALCSFVAGFLAFHTDAEARRGADER